MLGRLLVAVVAAAAVQAATTTFSISPSGSDAAGDGSLANPWATPARAQQAVRGVNGAGQSGDVIVYLRAGLYPLAATLQFTPHDSAGNGFRVIYARFAGDAAPVLHNAQAVTGWTQVDAARNLWSAPLPEGVAAPRQSYINGVRVLPSFSAVGVADSWTPTDTGYETTAAACPPGWGDALQAAADIELLYTGSGSSWTECRVRVASIAALPGGGCNVTMAQPGFALARSRFYGQGVQKPAQLQNLVSLLGAATPGSGYINSATRTVYYVPRASENIASAFFVVPGSVEVLASLQGDTSGPVRGVHFFGLTFAYAGWLVPSSGLGYVDMQSGFRVLPSSTVDDTTWVPIPGNVQMHTVENVSVADCTFEHLGATALEIDNGSQGVHVHNSTFVDISAGGIYFGQVSDLNVSASRENRDFLVENNYFGDIPVEFRDAAALLGGFVVNATLAHNSIVNCSNTGISLGWGWARDEASNSGDNVIEANYIYGSNWLLEDGGSIYVLGPQPRSAMRANFVSHQRKLYGALYTDEGSAYWYISGNVVSDVPEWLHIWTPSIHDELVELNWSDQTYQDVHGTNCTVRNNTFVTPVGNFPPEAMAVESAAGVAWMAGPKP